MEDAFSLLYVSKDFPEIYARRGRESKAGSRKEIEHFLRLTYGVLSAIEREVTLPTRLATPSEWPCTRSKSAKGARKNPVRPGFRRPLRPTP
jgi:hypothetical protein